MKGKKHRGKKLIAAILLPIAILMAVTYVIMSFYFEDHYYCHTIIGGEDYSYRTPVEAEEMLYSRLDSYCLEITGREGISDVVVPADIKMRFLIDDTLIKIKRGQQPGGWLTSFFKTYTYDFPWKVVYDETALKERVEELPFFQAENIKKPKDAYLTYDSGKKQYVIVAADPGTEVIGDKAEKELREALENLGDKLDLEEKGCYTEAAIDKEDEGLIKLRDEANHYMQAQVVYDWNGNQVVVDADIVQKWITIKGNRVVLNEEAVKEFVAEQAEQYDTYGKNRMFETTDGRKMELPCRAYGWKTDSETEGEKLIENLQKGERIEKKPEYSYTAAEAGENDIGDTYVEIDLGKQHLYLYVEGELILESDFVSGNASRGWSTPAGVFSLTYKTKNAVLRGENYATPVSYWMPFNGNIGMHDATWRSSFGGNIYLTNGSHGCINLPYENAKIIYDYLYTGFPVVCYY